MSKVDNFWKNFLTIVLTKTYHEFLSHDEISTRVEWMVKNKSTITPNLFYKNVLFNMNNLPISKIAIGYKLAFLTKDWQKLFTNPQTEEIDCNSNLSNENHININKLIQNYCICLNHHSELVINNGANIDDIEKSILDVTDHFEIPQLKYLPSTIVNCGLNNYVISFSQLLYMAAFNQNPYTGMPINKDFYDFIIENYEFNVNVMKSLQSSWNTGIPLNYVKSYNIFP